jgi:hypothetical protein
VSSETAPPDTDSGEAGLDKRIGRPQARARTDAAAGPAEAGHSREFCAAVCRALGEPLIGTAPPAAVGWLLVEHPGPWPAFGLPRDLPEALKAYSARALEFGVRTQLIRRPGRSGRAEWPHEDGAGQRAVRVMIAGGPPQNRWLEQVMLSPDGLGRGAGLFAGPIGGGALGEPAGTRSQTVVGDLVALVRTNADAFRSPRGPGIGAPVAAALLVCTHGRREVCCAKYGRPVAAALDAEFGPIAWETTHIGGDRFAAGLVALPSGAYFGRLDPAEGVSAARAALAGELDLEHYRGTAGTPAAVQAAECFLRREFGLTRLHAVRHVGGRGLAERFHVDAPDGVSETASKTPPADPASVFEVELTRRPAGCARLTSCGSGTIEQPPAFRLQSITALPSEPGAVEVPSPCAPVTAAS